MKKIIFEYNNSDNEYALESAWADKVGNYYKLDNILFYAPEYSWGDIVSIQKKNNELFVTGLVKESGHSTVRIIFYNKKDVVPTRQYLKEMGCESEISNVATLIAVDIPPVVDYNIIKRFLDIGEKDGKWSYQESCIAHTK